MSWSVQSDADKGKAVENANHMEGHGGNMTNAENYTRPWLASLGFASASIVFLGGMYLWHPPRPTVVFLALAVGRLGWSVLQSLRGPSQPKTTDGYQVESSDQTGKLVNDNASSMRHPGWVERVAAVAILLIGIGFLSAALDRYRDYSSYEIAIEHARALAVEGKYEQAVQAYGEVLQRFPEIEPEQVYTYRGIAHIALGEYDRALADLDLAIKLDSRQVVAYRNRGGVYAVIRRDPQRAIADLDQAIKLDPNNMHAYYLRGFAYSDQGDAAKARADFASARALATTDEDRAFLGEQFRKLGIDAEQ